MVHKPLDTEGIDLSLLDELTPNQLEDYLKCKYGEDSSILIEWIKDKLNSTLWQDQSDN
jgi:hypothetical protein